MLLLLSQTCLGRLQFYFIFSICPTEEEPTEEESGGVNTTAIVLVVGAVLSILVAVSVFLGMKYKSKSTEITPIAENQKSETQVKQKVKKRKIKHSSPTTGLGEGPGADKTGEEKGVEKKKKRRKRVGNQVQMVKEGQESVQPCSTKDTQTGK